MATTTAPPSASPSAAVVSPLDLISSPHPGLYTRLVDLSCRLGPAAVAHNLANPSSPIRLLAKAEYENPGMSHKDRIAKAMLSAAESRGALSHADTGARKTIMAASSGNTGCSLALVGTLMGYKVVVITNAKCSEEKRAHIRANGADLWLAEDLPDRFECLQGVTDYMEQEKVLCEKFGDTYYSVNQYDNLDNMAAHYGSTGREIWEQTDGAVTHFVMAGSTGGTIMGVGKFLKEKKESVKVVLSDPAKSRLRGLWEVGQGGALAEQGSARLKPLNGKGVLVEGAGKESLTRIMSTPVYVGSSRGAPAASAESAALSVVDACVTVQDLDAFEECRHMARSGVMAGGSAGVNVVAARELAEGEAREGGAATIVTLLCDHGIKYLSKIYNDEWIAKNDTREKKQ